MFYSIVADDELSVHRPTNDTQLPWRLPWSLMARSTENDTVFPMIGPVIHV